MMTGIRLEINNLQKQFNQRLVLGKVVTPGEFVAIVGQSGCGKSTLFSSFPGRKQLIMWPWDCRTNRTGKNGSLGCSDESV